MKRDVFLQRIAAMLAQRGRGHVDDDAVADIAKIGAHRSGTPAGGLSSELLAAAPAIQHNNPDHGCDHQHATES